MSNGATQSFLLTAATVMPTSVGTARFLTHGWLTYVLGVGVPETII